MDKTPAKIYASPDKLSSDHIKTGNWCDLPLNTDYVPYVRADLVMEAKSAIERTRSLVANGAMEGFNPLVGNWAEELFVNNANLTRIIRMLEEE